MAQEGESDRGGAFDVRSCSYDDRDPIEICCILICVISLARARSIWLRFMRSVDVIFGTALSARGYFVSTVGRDEQVIWEYFRNQEIEDARLEELNLWR